MIHTDPHTTRSRLPLEDVASENKRCARRRENYAVCDDAGFTTNVWADRKSGWKWVTRALWSRSWKRLLISFAVRDADKDGKRGSTFAPDRFSGSIPFNGFFDQPPMMRASANGDDNPQRSPSPQHRGPGPGPRCDDFPSHSIFPAYSLRLRLTQL